MCYCHIDGDISAVQWKIIKASAVCSWLGCSVYEWASVLHVFDTDIKSFSAQTTKDMKPPTM